MANPIAKYLLIAAGVGLAIGLALILDRFVVTEDTLLHNAPEYGRRSSSSSGNKPELEEEEDDEEEESLEQWIENNASLVEVEDGDAVPDMLACKICLNSKKRVSQVFACGHATCLECAVLICKANRGCPFDRKRISRAPRPFLLA